MRAKIGCDSRKSATGNALLVRIVDFLKVCRTCQSDHSIATTSPPARVASAGMMGLAELRVVKQWVPP